MNKYSRICSCHFYREMFDRTGSTVRLRENAVPQIHTIYTQTPPLMNFSILDLINSAKSFELQQVYSENNVEQCSSHKNQDFPMQEESGQNFVQHGIEKFCLNNTEVCTLHENGNVSEEAERESVLHVQGAFNPSILEVIITEDLYE
ncbi:uncharacterized protein LOC117169571 [Belonocnema kinseyi]|uniref:uncharacterized protein LOC117169571 n=1 Tax=Belonocnema kinseyi TaxID=2817044 RepID=UPI00143D5DFB|nr:uncharacterized protein LOC117169571 [Belonocnema kinseyi]